MPMNVCYSPLHRRPVPNNRSLDMIIDNDPLIERHISVPKDMSQLSCSSFTAGIVEAVLDGLGFVRFLHPIIVYCSLIVPFPPARSRHRPQHSHGSACFTDNYSHQTRKVCFGKRRTTQIVYTSSLRGPTCASYLLSP
jgi:hypothetical protein